MLILKGKYGSTPLYYQHPGGQRQVEPGLLMSSRTSGVQSESRSQKTKTITTETP